MADDPRDALGPQAVARRVSAWAALRGLTQAQLAAELGVALPTLNRWLNGRTSLGRASGRALAEPTPLARLAALLDVSEAELTSPAPWRVAPERGVE